jgi:hypothetical protein
MKTRVYRIENNGEPQHFISFATRDEAMQAVRRWNEMAKRAGLYPARLYWVVVREL